MSRDSLPFRSFASFDDARAVAQGELDAPRQAGPFDRLDWFEALFRRAFAGKAPQIFMAGAEDGASAWLFMRHEIDASLTGIANWYSFHFHPVFAGSTDAASRAALVTRLARGLRGRTHRLTFYPVIDDQTLDADMLCAALRAGGWWPVARMLGMRRAIALAPGESFADYWAARPSQLRKTHARKSRQRPLDIRVTDRVDDQDWATLERLFATSWKTAGGDDFGFLRSFAESEAAAGRLRIGFAHAGETPVAVELWTIDNGTAYIHKNAFDEAFADASPGTQLTHAMFAHAIDVDHAETIDFGTGDNNYKAMWMPEAQPMRRIDAYDLRKPRAWLPAIKARISALSPSDRVNRWSPRARLDGRRKALADAKGKTG